MKQIYTKPRCGLQSIYSYIHNSPWIYFVIYEPLYWQRYALDCCVVESRVAFWTTHYQCCLLFIFVNSRKTALNLKTRFRRKTPWDETYTNQRIMHSIQLYQQDKYFKSIHAYLVFPKPTLFISWGKRIDLSGRIPSVINDVICHLCFLMCTIFMNDTCIRDTHGCPVLSRKLWYSKSYEIFIRSPVLDCIIIQWNDLVGYG